ncbi:rod-binding protein [Sulfurospirillum arcachonense]|uniref:rod-binding protein n=1 Tax=Sulfurospirillum arcachonense TaxID=57666 RepID=UPI001FE1B351|nr:rod-binding protein [Sulfurospirillum arcachonense]
MHTTYSPQNIKVENSSDAQLKEQTDKFEAFFIKKVLDISLKNDNKLFEKDAGDKIYNSMYNDAMSNSLTGKFGFSEMLFGFLKEGR